MCQHSLVTTPLLSSTKRLIEECLKQVRALPVNEMPEEELMRKMKELKDEVLSHGNTYIQSLLSSSTVC